MSADTATKPVEQQIAEKFAADVADHEMTVLLDQGLYRHLRFMRRGGSSYWFDLITWPGRLAICGDIEGFMFSRTADMLEFFRSSAHRGQPNIDYWAEKSEGGRDAVKEYSEDLFRQYVLDSVAEFAEESPELADTVKAELAAATDDGETQTDDDAHRLLRRWEDRGAFSDTWEVDLRDYSWWFQWACHAIVWAIGRHDKVTRYGLASLATPSAVSS